MRRDVLALAVLAGCAAPAHDDMRRLAPPAPRVDPVTGPWRLTWRGAPIGVAWEIEQDGRFTRRERVIVRRGDAIVATELSIEVVRDEAGAPSTITVARWGDGPALAGRATRTARGWAVAIEGEAAASLPAAVPFELAVREAWGRGGFHGPVVLAGWGFAVAELSLAPAPTDRADRADRADGAWLAQLAVGDRTATARILYDDRGGVLEVIGGDGVVARAATPGDPRWPPATIIEVVDGNALRVDGIDASVAGVRFPDASAPPPPALPGQRVRAAPGGGWEVRFASRGTGGDQDPAIAALVRRVADEVADDLGATATTTGAALAATRGDCTTHALRFVALAGPAGIPAQIVTGLRLDGDQLVRHRWNLAWTGTRWLAVDPTWAETPAITVIALAVHGARAADLAAADAMVFDGIGATAQAIGGLERGGSAR